VTGTQIVYSLVAIGLLALGVVHGGVGIEPAGCWPGSRLSPLDATDGLLAAASSPTDGHRTPEPPLGTAWRTAPNASSQLPSAGSGEPSSADPARVPVVRHYNPLDTLRG